MSIANQPPDSLALERIQEVSSRLFTVSLAILAQSIPADEQLSTHRLAELLGRDDYRLYTHHSNTEVYACALLYLPSRIDFAWLDYMAVRRDMRGRGIGSRLFQGIVSVARGERPTAKWLLFEVDDDREGSEEMRQSNRQRIRFYRRLGALLLSNVPYRFPSATGRSVPMRLMAYRLQQGAELSPQYVRRAIASAFLAIHRRDSDDPLLAWILEHAPSALVLE